MSEAKFKLRYWVSNSPQLKLITHEEHTAEPTEPANILGVHWHTDTDKLSIVPKTTSFTSTNVTKREVFQDSSKVFDPLGLAVPVTIHAKLLLQTLWQKQWE